MSINSESVDDTVYENNDILRYDADPYHRKYGDKWKKLATSVRDVPQDDGSIIREYVIEDPSLLDDLSEQEDENIIKKRINVDSIDSFNTNNNFTKNFNNTVINDRALHSPIQSNMINNSNINNVNNVILNKFNNILPSTVTIKRFNKNQTENNNNKNNLTFNNKVQQNLKYFNRQLSNENSKMSNINNRLNIEATLNVPQTKQKIENNKKYSLSDDDIDREVETIQLESHKNNEYLASKQNQETIVEYEIVDEHGNLIKIDDAEKLKQLATCVKHVQDSDGSIIKEYILNDPKAIEQIKQQIKERENNNNKLEMNKKPITPSSSSSSTSSASIPLQQKEHNKQYHYNGNIKSIFNNDATNQEQYKSNYKLPTHLQMNNNQINRLNKQNSSEPTIITNFINEKQDYNVTSKLNQTQKDTELRQIDFNKYEILTTSGKTIQFIITDGNASSSDVKEIKNAIENKILNVKNTTYNQPSYQIEKNLYKALAPQHHQPQQIGNYYKTNRSCDDLLSIDNDNNNDKKSAFINYKTSNNHSQASLAKLKNYDFQNETTLNNFKRSKSLGYLNDLPNDDTENEIEKNDSTSPVTPEMTEKLILNLLLQQIATDPKAKTQLKNLNNIKIQAQPPPPQTQPPPYQNLTKIKSYEKILDLKDTKFSKDEMNENKNQSIPYKQQFSNNYYNSTQIPRTYYTNSSNSNNNTNNYYPHYTSRPIINTNNNNNNNNNNNRYANYGYNFYRK